MKNLKFILVIIAGFTLISCVGSNDKKNARLTPYNEIQLINHSTDFVYAAEQSIDAVVHIKSKIIQNNIYRYYDAFSDFFYGNGYKYYNKPQEKNASGSGVIISDDGYIVTNNHVINDATAIEVVLNDKRVYEAEILGVDPTTDLALLKINANELKAINLANSDDVKVGQWVIAVGNPFNLNSTVTAGIISAKGRSLNLLQNPHAIESFIQTDAAINAGNSGGALVSIKGELIGINTAIQSNTGSYTGYGFAIPSNMVKKIVSDLKKYGQVKRAFIGIQITEINSDISRKLKLKNNDGILITKIIDGGAASVGGIEELDVLIAIEGITINSIASLQEQVSKYSPGDIVQCTIIRDNKEIEITLDLTE
jgi:serine protease Do